MFDLAAIKRAHRQLMADTEQAVNQAMRSAAPEARKHVRNKAGFTHQSGATLNATDARVIRLRGGGKIIVSNTDRKARWLEHGTRAHVIRPRRARYLRFYWRKFERIVYFKSVRHPGTRAYRFLYLATHAVGDRVRLKIQGGMRRAAKRF